MGKDLQSTSPCSYAGVQEAVKTGLVIHDWSTFLPIYKVEMVKFAKPEESLRWIGKMVVSLKISAKNSAFSTVYDALSTGGAWASPGCPETYDLSMDYQHKHLPVMQAVSSWEFPLSPCANPLPWWSRWQSRNSTLRTVLDWLDVPSLLFLKTKTKTVLWPFQYFAHIWWRWESSHQINLKQVTTAQFLILTLRRVAPRDLREARLVKPSTLPVIPSSLEPIVPHLRKSMLGNHLSTISIFNNSWEVIFINSAASMARLPSFKNRGPTFWTGTA